MTRVLVTGATGAVGAAVVRALRASGRHPHGVSRHDHGPDHSVWHAGVADPPPELASPWDAIVHCAADTRWNLPDDEAARANVDPLLAVLAIAGPRTHVVHLSSSFATGLRGDVSSPDRAAYRNSYEWSKATAERRLRALRPDADVVRFPLVVGRRTDGVLDRYSGFFWLPAAMCSGAVPALVAEEDGLLDMVSTDDVAGHVTRLLDAGTPTGNRLSVLGRGADAPRVAQAFDRILDALNDWRTEHGAGALDRLPYVTPRQWNRFYLPFVEEHLDRAQALKVTAFRGYQDYLSISRPFDVTVAVPDLTEALELSVRRWADTHPAAARRVPQPWSARRPDAARGGGRR
ncbi:NAD-dependent epimerase/dehydratase family protein [Actinophytocola sediminis]